MDIPLTESGVNLNWSQIMKMINDHPLDFFQNGGWSFLGGPGENGDEQSVSEESDEESAFEDEVDDAYGMPQPTFEYVPDEESARLSSRMMKECVFHLLCQCSAKDEPHVA